MRSVVVAGALALIAVSCGGSSSSDSADGEATESSEVAVTEAPTTTDTPVTEAPAATDTPTNTDEPTSTDGPTSTDEPSTTKAPIDDSDAELAQGENVDLARFCELRDLAAAESDEFFGNDVDATGEEVVAFFEGQASLTRDTAKVAELEVVAPLILISNAIDQLAAIVVDNGYDLDASEAQLNDLFDDEGLDVAGDRIDIYTERNCLPLSE